jgi:hypothetical protein
MTLEMRSRPFDVQRHIVAHSQRPYAVCPVPGGPNRHNAGTGPLRTGGKLQKVGVGCDQAASYTSALSVACGRVTPGYAPAMLMTRALHRLRRLQRATWGLARPAAARRVAGPALRIQPSG